MWKMALIWMAVSWVCLLTYLIVRWPAPTLFLLFLSSIVTMIILLNEGFTRKYTKK